MIIRIGLGYDVHSFEEGRDLVLGGVRIPFERGLLGHSDADVLLHAISDALLGAAALGDIGTHFPDHDPQYLNISSLLLLKAVWGKITAAGYGITNIDCTIIAQKPKLAPYIASMQRSVAEALQIKENQISVKATTTEGLGFAGREEGMACHAVCALLNIAVTGDINV